MPMFDKQVPGPKNGLVAAGIKEVPSPKKTRNEMCLFKIFVLICRFICRNTQFFEVSELCNGFRKMKHICIHLINFNGNGVLKCKIASSVQSNYIQFEGK